MNAGSPVPKSLKRRGVSVPFTSSLLTHARVRIGPDSLEYLLPDLGDGQGYYIVPADHLKKLPGMSVFDNALFSALENQRMLSPFGVAKQAAQIARTGLGGAWHRQRSRAYLQHLKQEAAGLTLTLIHSAIAQLSQADDAARQLDRAGLATPQGIQAASKALGGFAKKAQITSDELFQRLEDWTQLLVPLGLGDEAFEFSSKATLDDMDGVARDLKQWLISEPIGPAELAQRTALAMQYTAVRGRELLTLQTGLIDNMGDTLSDWENKRIQIADTAESLQYLISGWKKITDLWHSRENRERFSQRELLQETAPFLPALPNNQAGPHEDFWTELRRLQPAWAEKTQLVQRMDHAITGSLARFRREVI